MITVRPYASLGHADHGWLDARHHFSFAHYWDPSRVHFGELRVINDDKVEAQKGFGTHAHDNMEIITYVRKGAITHKDSLGNEGRTGAGDVQVMSAGSGVQHSEFNREDEATKLYQIWILPNQKNVAPRWEARAFPRAPVTAGPLPVLVSGRDEDRAGGALFIYQDAAISGGRLAKGTVIQQQIKHQAYILASEGSIMLDGVRLDPGDGAEVVDVKDLKISADTDAEVLVIDVPSAA